MIKIKIERRNGFFWRYYWTVDYSRKPDDWHALQMYGFSSTLKGAIWGAKRWGRKMYNDDKHDIVYEEERFTNGD